jgi:hypothetical protein
MGIVRYAQKRVLSSVRRRGMREMYSLKAKKLTKARMHKETLTLPKTIREKIKIITHQDFILRVSSVKSLSGFALALRKTTRVAKLKMPRIPTIARITF